MQSRSSATKAAILTLPATFRKACLEIRATTPAETSAGQAAASKTTAGKPNRKPQPAN